MSSRSHLDKRAFLACINLGFKPEYEFGTGSDYYKFITNELGVIDENEIKIQEPKYPDFKERLVLQNNIDFVPNKAIVKTTITFTNNANSNNSVTDDVKKSSQDKEICIFKPDDEFEENILQNNLDFATKTETIVKTTINFTNNVDSNHSDVIDVKNSTQAKEICTFKPEDAKFEEHLIIQNKQKKETNVKQNITFTYNVDNNSENANDVVKKCAKEICTFKPQNAEFEEHLVLQNNSDFVQNKETNVKQSITFTNKVNNNIDVVKKSTQTKEICTVEESEKDIMESIKKGDNFSNIEIIFVTNENDTKNNEIQTNGTYQCYICHQSFSEKAEQRQHLTSHFKKLSKLTTCPFCGKTFLNKKELTHHFTIHLTKHSVEISKNQCKICLKTFSRSANLNRHLNSVHNKIKCKVCSKTFDYKYCLKKHMLSHPIQRDHKCNICEKSFQRKYHLNRHLKVHTVTKKYKCQSCFKECANNSSLEFHSTNKCQTCVTNVISLSDQINHQHQNFCSKEFLTQHLLDIHKNKHELKELFCSVCSRHFINKSSIMKHMKIHCKQKDFKCQQCAKQFITNYHLKRHIMLVHIVQKDFECPVCLKSFKTKNKMKSHLKVHTRSKYITCKICSMDFYTVRNLRNHLKNHTFLESDKLKYVHISKK